MPRSFLSRALPIGAAAAIGATALIATPAVAAPGDDVLLFANPNVVDTSPSTVEGELAYLHEQLDAIGMTVTEFTGGDGTAAAWEAALAGVEVVVFPEPEVGPLFAGGVDPTDAWLSDAAAAELAAWAQAGGQVVISGIRDATAWDALMSVLTGVDFAGSYDGTSSNDFAPRVVADASLPENLPYANGTYALDIGDWTADQTDILTPWYADGDYLWAGLFEAGSGSVGYLAWDFYPFPADDSVCVTGGGPSREEVTYAWNLVLTAIVEGGAPSAPVSATWTGTGFPVSITAQHGDLLGSGAWSAEPATWAVSDRGVGAGAELEGGRDFVTNPEGFDGCFAVDVDDVAQTITVTPLVTEFETGSLHLVVSSPSFSSVTLVSDQLFDYAETDWALTSSFGAGTLTADWRSADLTAYAADEETQEAAVLEGGSAVFAFERADLLPATGDTDAPAWSFAAFGLLALGAVLALATRRRRATV